MKPDKNFRLSKYSKRRLATEVDSHKRGEWKRALIQAELAERKAKLAKIVKGNNQGDEA